jgi:hypothetical protein
MQRIIYLDTDTGYKTLDVSSIQKTQEKEASLKSKGKYVVCVLDMKTNQLRCKCKAFGSHASFIKTCYPNALLD